MFEWFKSSRGTRLSASIVERLAAVELEVVKAQLEAAQAHTAASKMENRLIPLTMALGAALAQVALLEDGKERFHDDIDGPQRSLDRLLEGAHFVLGPVEITEHGEAGQAERFILRNLRQIANAELRRLSVPPESRSSGPRSE